VAFSPDGKTLASGHRGGTIKLWDSATGEERATLEQGHGDSDRYVAFSPDGRVLAAANYYEGTVTLWDAVTGKYRARLDGHALYVSCVAFTADGKKLASGSYDKTVKLWEVAAVLNGRE
jgi:WD40 repeat protein